MATSYANLGGAGERRRTVIVTAAGFSSFAGTPSSFVDGDTTSNGRIFWTGSLTGSVTLTFDFGDSSYVIDEAKFYQQTSDSHGTWKWRGSNNGGGTWTDIGSSFTLGGSSAQTITALNGNVADYQMVQLQGVSGSVSGSPWLYQFEFKISAIVSRTNGLLTTSYSNMGGIGDRATGAIISISAADNGGAFLSSTGTDTAALKTLINGTYASTESTEGLDNPTAAGGYVRFDFGAPKIIDEAILWTGGNSGASGTFKWRGSGDDSSFTDVATGISLLVPSGGGGSANAKCQIFRQLNPNTTAYRYWRFECTSGASTSATGMTEFEFRLADPVAAGGPFPHYTRRNMCGGMISHSGGLL